MEIIRIGNQEWSIKNLDVDSFRNGEIIPECKTVEEWESAGEDGNPAWCYYENNKTNGEKYGKLYNWYAVKDLKGLAPTGWHIPSDDEWAHLIENLGGKDTAGPKMKQKEGWNNDGNGNNESGFSGLPHGYRGNQEPTYYDCNFGDVGKLGGWWSSTEKDRDNAWGRDLFYRDASIGRFYTSKKDGNAVRCIQD